MNSPFPRTLTFATDERSVSYVLGALLVFGIVVTASVAVVGLTVVSLSDDTEHFTTDAAEVDFADIANTIESQTINNPTASITRSSERASINLPGDGRAGYEVTQNTSQVNLDYLQIFGWAEIANASAGTIVYEPTGGEGAVVFENGAIFNQNQDGTVETVRDSPLSVEVGEPLGIEGGNQVVSMNIPVFDFDNTQTIFEDADIRAIKSTEKYTEREYDPAFGPELPLRLEIETEFPEAWAGIFERKFAVVEESSDYEVQVNAEENTANVIISAEEEGEEILAFIRMQHYELSVR